MKICEAHNKDFSVSGQVCGRSGQYQPNKGKLQDCHQVGVELIYCKKLRRFSVYVR